MQRFLFTSIRYGHKLSQWFCQNRLSKNRDKCEANAFGTGQSESESESLILDKKVAYSNACNYLGVTWTERCASESLLITS